MIVIFFIGISKSFFKIRELNIFENNVNEAILKGLKTDPQQNNNVNSISSANTSMFSTSSKDSGAVKLRIGTAKKK
jgi:hypothetical protein